MNKLVITTILFAVLAFVNADSSSEEGVKEVAELLKSKFNTTILLDAIAFGDKVKSKCPDIEKKIETAVDEVGECIENIELGSETFCSLIKKNLKKCSKPAVDVVTSCSPDESRDIPALIEDIILAIVNQACQSTVEEILELFNPCLTKKEFTTFQPCTDVKTILDEHKNKLPSKSLICSTLPKIKNCIKEHEEASCQNPITRSSSLKFQDAILNSIKDDCKA